jgi:hypothetical protein
MPKLSSDAKVPRVNFTREQHQTNPKINNLHAPNSHHFPLANHWSITIAVIEAVITIEFQSNKLLNQDE